MVIKVKCRCGRGIKVRDSAAGKRVRCPECSKPVSIPEPVVEEFDDYGDDDYGDDPYSQPTAPPPRRRKPAASGKRSSKAKKSAGSGSKMPLIIAGSVITALLVIGSALWATFGGGSGDTPNVAVNNSTPPDANPAATPALPPTADPSPTVAETNTVAASADPPAATNPEPAPVAAPPPMTTSAGAGASGGQLWVVLSDFKAVASPQSIGKTYQVNYRIASGKPEPGKSYVVYMGASMGIMERYNEVPVDLQSNGTVHIPSGIGMSGKLRAYVGWKKGPKEWEPVSGEITVGGPATAPQRPPTVVEAAGAAAQGKTVALANARFEQGRAGRNALVVDYVLQQKVDMSQRHILVIQGNGDPINADVTMQLMRAKVGEKGEMGLSLLPGRNFPTGSLKVHMETHKSRIMREPGQVVSNTVFVQR